MEKIDLKSSRMKKAELLSGVGALVLGVGLGLLFSSFLKPYTVPALLVGFLMHAWGMFDKRRLEKASSGARVWWVDLFYWVCWVALLGLVIYVAIG